jgi:tetratricopeptide (TPR) repeat protein
VWLGWLLSLSGRFAEAEEEAKLAMLLGQTADDPIASSYGPNLRGIIALHGRRYAECAEYSTAAVEASRADGNKHSEAAALSNLSRAQLELGETEAAVATCEQALAINRELGTGFRLLGNTLYAMSISLTATGRLDEALESLAEALRIFQDARQQFWEGMTLFRLAKVHLASGALRQSAAHAEQALAILREVGGEWRRANALTVLGSALSGLGQQVRAHACWHDALGIYGALGSPEAHEVRRLLGDGPSSAPSVAV